MRARAAFLALLLALPTRSMLQAQGVRIRGVTTMRFIELRPFVDDSVAYGATQPGSLEYRELPDGTIVRCAQGDTYCRFKRSGAAANSLPIVQDLQISAWGLGQGISAHADLRVRGVQGSQPNLYPRASDKFDALTAYVELDRSSFTTRLGRQYASSGLGVYNYDGASVVVRPTRRITLEGFGGWSLLQGVNESFTSSELAAVDELPPDRNAYIVGLNVRVRPTDRSAISAFYQREVRDNRSALYSERVAVNGTWRVGRFGVEGVYQEDLSTGMVNEARARLRLPAYRNTVISVEARRFRPFFELWTIWGAFAPVGFDEARVQASWRNTGQSLSFDVHGAKRRWDETVAGLDFAPLRADGWRVGGDATWRVTGTVHANAGYSADVGFGAARSEGDVGVHWEHGRMFIGATASTFQSIYELRVGTARVIGLGLDAGWQINPDVRLVADAALYQQTSRNNAPTADWTQHRMTARFEWMLGSDPGAGTVSAAARKAAAKVRGEAELSRLASAHTGRMPASVGAPEIKP